MKSETYLGLDAQLKLRTWIDLATDSICIGKDICKRAKEELGEEKNMKRGEEHRGVAGKKKA
jgi:hypothetical protein